LIERRNELVQEFRSSQLMTDFMPSLPEGRIKRKPNIIFSDRGFARRRANQIVKLCQLDLVLDRIVAEFVQDRCEPPGKPYGGPDPAQRGFGVAVEQIGASFLVPGNERRRQVSNLAKETV
jgi:hypothetical protein